MGQIRSKNKYPRPPKPKGFKVQVTEEVEVLDTLHHKIGTAKIQYNPDASILDRFVAWLKDFMFEEIR